MLVVGVALIALSRPARDHVLMSSGVAVVLLGLVVGILGNSEFQLSGSPILDVGHNWSMELVAVVGAILGLAGLVLYRRERALV